MGYCSGIPTRPSWVLGVRATVAGPRTSGRHGEERASAQGEGTVPTRPSAVLPAGPPRGDASGGPVAS